MLQRPLDRAAVDRPGLETDTPWPAAGLRNEWQFAGQPLPVPAPAPSMPSPPPRETAAARAPPADPPIGASAIGCCTPNSSVNRVDSPIAAIMPPEHPAWEGARLKV
uniref:Uncharacterized protein n=1 Tax=Streptomyces avermitilis TaxID=33903 RepID=A0A499VV80_STRAX|nr:hypothetical protein SAVMC3_30360 [Streptomyces avermitilis]